ncbi:MAG TPA: TrkH family potassium uptake protein, partial [Alphaproteobacteria bacterium]|nr:TrkH family potassium uptake protein [Alphaproteobacteria bacterium]
GLGVTDSFFESVSGITTTGMTVMHGLDEAPAGILLWRALLQWLGGFGIVIMAMSVLPFLKVGGMQIFRSETGEDEKSTPRLIGLAQSVGLAYLALTILCILCFMVAGMTTFEAVTFGLSTISTGGFAPYDESFRIFDNPVKEGAAMIFMIAGCLPFILYVKLLRGRPGPLLRDSQVRAFLVLLNCATLLLFFHLVTETDLTVLESLRHAAFNTISVASGTGFTNTDMSGWGSLPLGMFLFLMAIGGCAGSTTCGLRMFRLQILYEAISVQVKRLLHPNGVFVPYFNRRPVPPDVPLSVMSFFFVFALSFVVLSLALSFVGLEMDSAISGAIASISNAGPVMSPLEGSEMGFADLSHPAKWILCFGMLLGRLEIFTVLVLLWPHYWRP